MDELRNLSTAATDHYVTHVNGAVNVTDAITAVRGAAGVSMREKVTMLKLKIKALANTADVRDFTATQANTAIIALGSGDITLSDDARFLNLRVRDKGGKLRRVSINKGVKGKRDIAAKKDRVNHYRNLVDCNTGVQINLHAFRGGARVWEDVDTLTGSLDLWALQLRCYFSQESEYNRAMQRQVAARTRSQTAAIRNMSDRVAIRVRRVAGSAKQMGAVEMAAEHQMAELATMALGKKNRKKVGLIR